MRSGNTSETVVAQSSWSWAFRRQAEAFISDVTTGHEPLANGLDALKDFRLAEALWRVGNGIRLRLSSLRTL